MLKRRGGEGYFIVEGGHPTLLPLGSWTPPQAAAYWQLATAPRRWLLAAPSIPSLDSCHRPKQVALGPPQGGAFWHPKGCHKIVVMTAVQQLSNSCLQLLLITPMLLN